MRLFLFLVGSFAALAVIAAANDDASPYDRLADAPPPLAAAIRNYAKDAGRWAYTQHSVEFDRKGKVNKERLIRYDPSRHYDEQWTLLSEEGREPTPERAKKYSRKQAKRNPDRRTLGELLELKHATLVKEDADVLTYEVPLVLKNNTRLPPEKFQVFVEIDRPTQTLRNIDVKLRDSMRMALVVKVKSGGAQLEFARVLPDFGPTLTGIKAEGAGSILLVPIGGAAEVKRTEFKRVTPYDERFEVKLGPLKAIDF